MASAPRFIIPVTGVPSALRLLSTTALASAIAHGARRHAMANDESRWLVVTVDSGIKIAVDTTHIEREYGHTFRIWSRTDHYAMRYYDDKAFNRETVQAILRCDGYSFRIVSTEMAVRGGGTVVRQVTTDGELSRQPWRRVEPGSVEADAVRAVCLLARR